MLLNIYEKLSNEFGFEIRQEQIKTSEYVLKSLKDDKKLLIEASTGLGKTLAYLIPSVIYAMENNFKIVISTNTINLQDQIVQKDLPILEKILNKNLNYNIIKGRNNYVCKRRLNDFYNINKLDDLYKSIMLTKDGVKSQINVKFDNKLWNEIKSDKDYSLNNKCPFFKECYYYKSKKKNENVDIFIVNHHILALDKYLKKTKQGSIIPDYNICIIDEAHNLEDILRVYFSLKFSFKDTFKYIGQIYNNRAKNLESVGLLNKLCSYLETYVNSFEVDNFKENFINLINDLYEKILFLREKIDIQEKLNLKKEILAKYIFKLNLEKDIKNIQKILKSLEIKVNVLNEILENCNQKEYILFNNIFSSLQSNIYILLDIFKVDFEKYIYWLKYDDIYPEINASLYNISDVFQENFKNDKLMLFSATLTVENSFEYIKNQLGISDNYEKIIHSSFDYLKQMKIIIPNDLPFINENNFKKEASKFCLKYLEKHKGKAFILFTSYTDLEYVYKYFKNKNKSLNLFKQGDYDRTELITKFKNTENSVLFGTDSFWEGVDVKGKALSIVILFKLPFQVPDNPIVASIIERLNKEKKSFSFYKYRLPYAILKTKQGIGRLIRSKEDKGNILILDKRIISKNYGKKIINSLPKTNIIIDSLESIINKI